MSQRTRTPSPTFSDHEYPAPMTAQPTGPRPANPTNPGAFTTNFGWPILGEPVDQGRKLSQRSMTVQRVLFVVFVALLNVGLALTAIFAHTTHLLLAFVIFFKAKDILCAVASFFAFIISKIYSLFHKPAAVPRQWILSMIPTYNESESQILKCIESLRDNDLGPHRQVMCVVIDGKPKELRSEMSRIVLEYDRPYHNLKSKVGNLSILAGWIRGSPVIVIEKSKNCGKKDSLVLAHDLFNSPRDNMPLYTKLLREDLWRDVLPVLTAAENGADSGFMGFNGVFCTDADSKVHKGALRLLIEAIARDKNAIAAAGSVFVELEKGYEWSFWNLYQQFQYTFGQYVRRRAESVIGKVTCLPGCVSMIAVRKEMAGAIKKYANPVTSKFILPHQVQNLVSDKNNMRSSKMANH